MYTSMLRRRQKNLVSEVQKKKKIVLNNFNVHTGEQQNIQSPKLRDELKELRHKLAETQQDHNNLMGYLSETLAENEKLEKELCLERKKSRDSIRLKTADIMEKIDEMKEQIMTPRGTVIPVETTVEEGVRKITLKKPPKQKVTLNLKKKVVTMSDGTPVIVNKK